MNEVLTREQREQFANRIEVLEKVKAILAVPQLCMATTEQVADYFAVPVDTIRSVYRRNKEEIDANGAVLLTPSQLEERKLQNALSVQDTKGTKLYCVNDVYFTVNNRGTRFFPPRAILCMAMMLRDSEVAAEIRTQLLNLVEAAPVEMKVENAQAQENAMLQFAKAMMEGKPAAIAQAVNDMMALKDHTIAAQAASIRKLSGEKIELEEKNTDLSRRNDSLTASNKMLADGISAWSPSRTTNAIIRKIGKSIYGGKYGRAWNEFYRELKYQTGICLAQRTNGKDSELSAIRDEEWPSVMRTVASLAYRYCIDVVDVTNESVVREYNLDRVETPNGVLYNKGIVRTISA